MKAYKTFNQEIALSLATATLQRPEIVYQSAEKFIHRKVRLMRVPHGFMVLGT